MKSPEPWALATGQIGTALVLVGLTAFVGSLAFRALKWRPQVASTLFTLGLACLPAAFLCLVTLFVTDQFGYMYVFSHGAADHELQYKVAGVWSGQEGSILLWGVSTAMFLALARKSVGVLRAPYETWGAAVMLFISGMLVNESPFKLAPPIDGRLVVPATGQGMAPSLLNYWVTIHPPTIFLGFGSLAVLYAWAMAAMSAGRLDSWHSAVRPWAITSLTLLGLGLCMGGFWAYETLGWGGFWMWDPVENTSFVPWCIVVALVHGLYVQAARGTWLLANGVMAGLPFAMFCYGTFLTRSGMLGDTSVHSFAEMDRSALWSLIAMTVLAALALVFVSFRAAGKVPARTPEPAKLSDRQSFIAAGIWLLNAFGVVTAIGMSVPLFQSLAGQAPKVVEERLYNTVLSFLFVPLMLAMAIGPYLSWRKTQVKKVWEVFANVSAVAIGLVGCSLLWQRNGAATPPMGDPDTVLLLLRFPVPRMLWVMCLTFVCLFTLTANVWQMAVSFRKARGKLGAFIAHCGVVVTLLGLVFSRGMERRDELVLQTGKPAEALGFKFTAANWTKDLSDRNNKVPVMVEGRGQEATLYPGLYYLGMDAEGQPRPMIWPAVHGMGMYDLYLVTHYVTFDASGETEIQPGQSRLLQQEGLILTYNGFKTEGPLGTAGATFIADVKVVSKEGEWNLKPSLKVGEHGLEETPAKCGSYEIALTRINAATKSGSFVVKYRDPAFVAEVFYKPLTLFVWAGVGIMTLGGALAAWSRRIRPASTEDVSEEAPQV